MADRARHLARAPGGGARGARRRLAAAETLRDETRKQLTQRELEVAELRAALDGEQAQRAAAEARWDAARQSVDEQRAAPRRGARGARAIVRGAQRRGAAQSNDSFLSSRGRRSTRSSSPARRPSRASCSRSGTRSRATRSHLRELEAAAERVRRLSSSSARSARRSERLQRETGTLATALRSSQARGRYGEVALRRIVELAGMTARCDFSEQVTAETAKRPAAPRHRHHRVYSATASST